MGYTSGGHAGPFAVSMFVADREAAGEPYIFTGLPSALCGPGGGDHRARPPAEHLR
jgi:hypothetical protein